MNKKERSVVIPVTIGSMLEWYEIFVYIYWSPIVESTLEIELVIPATDLLHATIVLAIALTFSRTAGGVWFGSHGDTQGRKKYFFWTLFWVLIPSLLTVFMPTKWVFFSFVYMGIMKFLQGFPAGGELPGALCFLEECTTKERRRYICSFLLLGPQLGQILSFSQSLLLKRFLPPEMLAQWGWRLSFLFAFLIGCLGLLLRSRLHESSGFESIKTAGQVTQHPVKELTTKYKKSLFAALTLSIFEVVSFFIIEFYLFEKAESFFGLNFSQSIYLYGASLGAVVILMPLFGKIASVLGDKLIFLTSCIGPILLAYPFYIALKSESLLYSCFIFGLLFLCMTMQFALLPSLLAEIFPTHVRFTALGFSFNLTDSLIGGFLPLATTGLITLTGNSLSFVWIIPTAALIFLLSFLFVERFKLRENGA